MLNAVFRVNPLLRKPIQFIDQLNNEVWNHNFFFHFCEI